MITGLNDVYDPLASIQCATCYDCLDEKPIYIYILLPNNETAPLCIECGRIRQEAARGRMGENERPSG